jgi:hypothetical protein
MRKIFLLTSLIFLAFCARSIAQNSNASPEAPKKFANEAEKKAYYNSINPTIPEFKNQAEKDAWVKSQKKQEERKPVSAMPNDPTFPVFVNSGNPEKDNADYDAKKKEWYAQQLKASKFDSQNESKVDFTNESDKNAWLALQKNKIEENSKVTKVTMDEFNKLPADKQAAMLSDKNYIIVK